MTNSARTPLIIAFLAGGALILAIGMFGRRGAERGDAVPALRILWPATGDTLTSEFTLRFETPARLRLTEQGWIAGELHLHAMVDGREVMPAAADITLAGDAYVWDLPPLLPGTHRIHLTWAGRHHGNLAGPADTITVHILP